MINDESVKEYLKKHLIKFHNKVFPKYIDKEILDYINNRYNDSESFKESVHRILFNIDIRPICRCGNHLGFKSILKGYFNHCSNSCAQSDPNVFENAVKLKREKYGTANNYNKIKETNKIKYGVEYSFHRPEVLEKKANTMIERYGNANYRDIEKSKQTCLKKYGSEYYLTSNDCKQKVIKKFGVDNYRKTDECKQLVGKYHKEHKDELNEKRKQTSLERYGVDNVAKVKEFMDKINWNESLNKMIETKRKNNSFHISKLEDKSYILLYNKFGNVIKQYKSDDYPFACDFYIPYLNLYIECNYHWTHGGHPYSGDENDLIQVNKWKEKNTNYYNNAINCWTIRDVKKRNIAKQNKLNYKEFFSIVELNKWLDNYEI